MSTPTNENIALVMNGFEQFLDHVNKTKGFNVQEFVNFMEPKFAAADYREIRRLYPDARITLVVPPHNLQLIYGNNLKLAFSLLEQRFDICFAFAIYPATMLLMYISGARIRVTSICHENLDKARNPDELISHVIRLATHLFPCSTLGSHNADDAFSLLENLLHLPITNRRLEVWYTPADVAVVKSYLRNVSKPLYGLCMGGSGFPKKYPPEKYAKLIEMILSEEPAATFVILGGGQADLNSAAIIRTVAPELYANHVVDLTDKINYRQSGAVLSLCDTYIGNDTGTMHLAAATDCPVLSPNCFAVDLPTRPTDIPQLWYPYGVPSVIVQPEHALPECKNRQFYFPYGCLANRPHCITQIKPETLFRGFHLLKERIEAKICEPLYIH